MWWWIQFVIVLFVIEIVWIFISKHKDGRDVKLAWLSIAITLFGIMMAIADTYLSQYDYDKDRIREHEFYMKKGVDYNSLVGGRSNTPPLYIFLMDVSKSTLTPKIGKTISIERQIDAINRSGRLTTTRECFNEDSYGRLTLSETLRIRLLYLLLQLEEIFFRIF